MDINQILKKYDTDNIVLAPPELNLPVDARIAIRSKDSSESTLFPSGSQLVCPGLYDRKTRKHAISRLVKNAKKHDCVILDRGEFRRLTIKLSERYRELPLPFYHEPLEAFTVKLSIDTEVGELHAEMHFAPSLLTTATKNSKVVFIPKVDFYLEFEKNESIIFTEPISGCIGLSPVPKSNDKVYIISFYYFSDISVKQSRTASVFIWAYFLAQYSFYVCPERVIEAAVPVDLAGNSMEITDQIRQEIVNAKTGSNGEPHLNNIKIRHTIYIGEPNRTKKNIIRHTECWYVRGSVVHLKDGRTYFRRGYFKGPKRNDPEARRRTKKYRLDKDCD